MAPEEITGETDFDRGLALRRHMFGLAGADKQLEAATDFTRPLQEIVTRSCFGEIWHRPVLDHKMRSIITIAMVAALGKPNQVKVHVKGALVNGVSREEIREILLQVMVYGGLPAAVEAFGAAAEALADVDSE
jgi:4-carboxymuconolactone decarboxylase